MATAEQMAALTEVLKKHTPLDKPVTEVCIFKLKEPHNEATTTRFQAGIVDNCLDGKGISRISWGYSLDDPLTLVWLLDWAKVQDHWDFWQTPAFTPVMNTITELFEPGRPLVRHIDFNPPGMIVQEFVNISVWDEAVTGKTEVDQRETIAKQGKWKATKGAYAIDMDETTWWCTVFGYDDEASARSDHITGRGETHLCKLKYFHDRKN